jgi:hypothetical protein
MATFGREVLFLLPAAFPGGGSQNGWRSTTPPLTAQREKFQTDNHFFDLTALMAKCRQDFVYIHYASETSISLQDQFLIYTFIYLAVNLNLQNLRSFPQKSLDLFSTD